MESGAEMFDLLNNPEAVIAKMKEMTEAVADYTDSDDENKELDRKLTLLAYSITASAPQPTDGLDDVVIKLLATKGFVYVAYLHGRKDERDGKGISDLLRDVKVDL